MNTIDYGVISSAIAHYADLGYQRIEVPWWVTADVANITKPTGVPDSSNYKLSVNGKCLLASGEQAFLYLANKGQLPPGKYQTVTPCFRNEEYDAEHSKQFMKLELIVLLSEDELASQDRVRVIANDALGFFRGASGLGVFCHTVSTGVKDPLAPAKTEQLDIVMTVPTENNSIDVELGSYGARRTSFATWIYGTGVAEPRFSKTLRRMKAAC